MNNRKDPYFNRKTIISITVAVIAVIYMVQLFNLQIVNKQYRGFADSNAFFKKTLYPSRGAIYDRNGELLVYNQATYDVMMVAREMNNFDTLDFCNTLSIDKETFNEFDKDMRDRRKNPGYSSYTPQRFMSKLNVREYAMLQEKLYKFPGIYIQNRTERQYKYPNMGPILGYIAEVDKNTMSADPYYARGDFAGKSGIELSHEEDLRGEKGVEVLLRDAHGRIQGKYEDGAYDKMPVSGQDLTLSIDIELQAYGEYLMQNKIGSIIIIEPKTGEILTMVAAPSYDPALLTGREFGENYLELARDPYKPLINRAVAGLYPPGSTYKPAQGVIFLQEGIITPDTRYGCAGGYPPLGGRPRCHGHPSPLSLDPALATSCNSYFCYGLTAMLTNRTFYKDINDAFDHWKDRMILMGFGNKLGVDLPSEKRGFIPNSKFYSKVHQTENWRAANIISIAIGQGEILTTPLQLANFAALTANRGYYYVPHVVKKLKNKPLDTQYTIRRESEIDRKHWEVAVSGMAHAVTGGTCRGIFMGPEVEVCGKTGTSQNPHGDDHSLFLGFAPKDDPQVAIAVIVENGRFGASTAVPIARLMFQKFFKDSIPDSDKWLEQRIVNTSILPNMHLRNRQTINVQ
ncbi:MAG: penicillin-binding protein 2 [Dysgonamonadaceae bacterium]|nr:penicillin-binding protein 2 [Dysgonamonadaceae bacterium]MDD3356397.1 penicillin-binding protein 2 [Dysgonamonadaceae bacterium]MDD3727803.1 penicillin-binding protein 2 [Dysgonamonadaceae bacterium]MDD4246068.1 penicillin-binding protein 2 [Dysgonamonadaceae bacterium]MDD4605613.1 penicillin-binding protein 2 [Dysgonamonadaceae bacterium]